MSFFLDKYLGLKIKTRIYLLCFCYSLCIIFGVGAGRSLPLTYSILTTALFVAAGAFFGGLLFDAFTGDPIFMWAGIGSFGLLAALGFLGLGRRIPEKTDRIDED